MLNNTLIYQNLQLKQFHLEYRAGDYAVSSGPDSCNVLLVGGPQHNKVTRQLVLEESGNSSSGELDGFVPFSGHVPVSFNGIPSKKERKQGENNSSIHANNVYKNWFRLGSNIFDADDQSLIFSFPFSSKTHTALAVCITSNTEQGYLHASRLAWPTVPPMVRAPFSNYMPDYIVFDGNIWAEGFGGVTMAGYWDSNWQYDASQAFMR